MRGEIRTRDGSWIKAPFLLDTGADRTVMSVLGRDVTNLFAVIIDWPQRFVCLLGQQHQYTILPRS
jgi:hypothetical protein